MSVGGEKLETKTVLLKSGEERSDGAAERKFWWWRKGSTRTRRGGGTGLKRRIARRKGEVREQKWEIEDRSLGSTVVKLITPRNCLN